MLKEINSFWGHVNELAKRMKPVLINFLAATFLMLLLPANADFLATTNNYQPLVSVFLNTARNYVLPVNVKLYAIQISDPITLYAVAAVLFGAAFTVPLFSYELYKFVDPALFDNERKSVYPFVTIVSGLFVAGCLFGFFFLFPAFINSMFPFFSAVGAELMFSIMDFYNLLFFTIIISGFIFTIPPFFVMLVKFNIIKPSMFRNKRKWIYLGMGVAALFISPGATPQGDLVLFLALAGLFEASMLAARRYESNNSSPSMLMAFLSPPRKCMFCQSEIDESTVFCSKCSHSVK